MKCDNCECYEWYYDHCIKWDCEVDARACHGCFEPRGDKSVIDCLKSATKIMEDMIEDVKTW